MVAALFQTLDTHFFAMFLYGLDQRFSPAIRKIPANSLAIGRQPEDNRKDGT
jgi:hypothetical protein